jgi:hypothetical protein
MVRRNGRETMVAHRSVRSAIATRVGVTARRGRPSQPEPMPLPSAAAPARAPAARPASVTSKTFWALMDRWGVADEPALTLIDRPGGLGASGRRPRFSLTPEQARRLEYLRDVDAALRESWGPAEPRQWLGRTNPDPVFAGRSPLEHMLRGGLPAIAEVLRFLHHWGLKQSLKLPRTA